MKNDSLNTTGAFPPGSGLARISAILAEMREYADRRAEDAGGERPAIELLRSYAERLEREAGLAAAEADALAAHYDELLADARRALPMLRALRRILAEHPELDEDGAVRTSRLPGLIHDLAWLDPISPEDSGAAPSQEQADAARWMSSHPRPWRVDPENACRVIDAVAGDVTTAPTPRDALALAMLANQERLSRRCRDEAHDVLLAVRPYLWHAAHAARPSQRALRLWRAVAEVTRSSFRADAAREGARNGR